MDDPVELDDLLKEFVEKATADLEATEDLRRDLRRDPSDPESLSKLLELVHTTKGACAFLNLPRIAAVSTALAGLLEAIQQGRVSPGSGSATLILGALSRMRQLVDGVARTGVEPEGDDSALLEAVDRMREAREDAVEAHSPDIDEAHSSDIGEAHSPDIGTQDLDLDGWAPARQAPPTETDPIVPPPEPETAAEHSGPEEALESARQAGGTGSRRYLLFRIEPEGLKAVSVGSVAWLDLVDMTEVDRSGNRPIARVRDWRLPLVPFDPSRVVPRTGRRSVVVLEDKGRRVGLTVDEVVGVIDRLIPAGPEDRGGPPTAEGPIEPIEAHRLIDRAFRMRVRS